jgi:hypothetical protein
MAKQAKTAKQASSTKSPSVNAHETSKTPVGYVQSENEGASSERLKNYSTLNWLKKRYSSQMPQEYSFNDTERQRHFAIQKIFQKFDTDGTGTLDVREL